MPGNIHCLIVCGICGRRSGLGIADMAGVAGMDKKIAGMARSYTD